MVEILDLKGTNNTSIVVIGFTLFSSGRNLYARMPRKLYQDTFYVYFYPPTSPPGKRQHDFTLFL